MNAIIGILAIVAMLLAFGALAALAGRGGVRWYWLLAAAALVLLNDALLTRGYGALPDLLPRSDWAWQGKAMALAASLAIAALPVLGWRHAGLTLRQEPGSLRSAAPVALAYLALFLALAFAFPNGDADIEAIAFQMTMPGLEEEVFYRGLLLLVLDRAFTARVRLFGVHWGWGAVASCALFGLAHAFGYGDEGFSFDAMTMALTALPSLIAVWVRYRTGSVALPIVMHNFGNTIFYLV